MTCEELHAILHLVLQAGNIMNQVRATTHYLFLTWFCEITAQICSGLTAELATEG